jgi:hypothetical protein
MPKLKRGWFTAVQAPRKPERFPLGIASTIPPEAGRSRNDRTPPLYPSRAFEMPLTPIAGGPVTLALPEGLGLLCWLAIFCHREVSPQIRVRDAGAFPAADLACRDDLHVQLDGPGAFTVHCFQWQTNAVRRVHLLASMLQALPEGAEIDFATSSARGPGTAMPSPDDDVGNALEPKPGMHRYRGRVSGGTWQVAASWPATAAATLQTALAIAEDIDLCRPIALPDDATARAVIAAMAENAMDYRRRGRSGEPRAEACGASIRLGTNPGYPSFEVGAFTLRHLRPDAWPYKLLEDKPLWPFG